MYTIFDCKLFQGESIHLDNHIRQLNESIKAVDSQLKQVVKDRDIAEYQS